MCVAIPARIKSVQGSLARVEIGGVERSASLQLTPEAKPGDYVLIHAGFAIHVIDEQEAMETLKLFEELEALQEVKTGAEESRGQEAE
jgi:hydrogenase expression/formation protein HypC